MQTATSIWSAGTGLTVYTAGKIAAVPAGISSRYVLTAILLAAAVTFALRALPFLIFRGDRKMPEFLVKLGAVLPAAIMAVLVVYCVKSAIMDWKNSALPQLLAVLTVGISYKWKHQTLLSIVAGTAVYMLLIRL